MTSGIAARPELSVIIVTYCSKDHIDRCLASIKSSAGIGSIEVVVVDNASTDDTVALVSRAFPDVTLIQLDTNIGFARAANLGAARSRADFIVLLNPDTVTHADALAAMLRVSHQHPEAGLVGGRTLTSDGDLEPSSCWGRPTVWSTVCFAFGLSTVFRSSPLFNPEGMPRWDRDDDRAVDIVTGCLLLASRTAWERLGGFDERFFMYGEDADLSLRAHEAGYQPRIAPDAEVVHTVGGSASSVLSRQVMVLKGRMTLLNKHWSVSRGRLAVALVAFGIALRAILAAALRAAGRTPTPAQATYCDLWRLRRDWLGGYRPQRENVSTLITGWPPPG